MTSVVDSRRKTVPSTVLKLEKIYFLRVFDNVDDCRSQKILGYFFLYISLRVVVLCVLQTRTKIIGENIGGSNDQCVCVIHHNVSYCKTTVDDVSWSNSRRVD